MQFVEFLFRPAVQDTIDVSHEHGFGVLRMHVCHQVDRRPFRHVQKFRVEVKRTELGIQCLQEREEIRELTVLGRDFDGGETLTALGP